MLPQSRLFIPATIVFTLQILFGAMAIVAVILGAKFWLAVSGATFIALSIAAIYLIYRGRKEDGL